MGTEILSPCMKDATHSHELTWIQSLPEIPRHYGHDKPNVMHSSTSPLTLERLATPAPSGSPSQNTNTQRTPTDLPQWTILSPSTGNDGNRDLAEIGQYQNPQRVEPRTATPRQIANDENVDECTQAASLSSPRAPRISSKSSKKALFDGVLITTRPPKPTLPCHADSSTERSVTPTTFSLLNALQRTFDANNRSSLSLQDDDASNTPQTDLDAATDDERVLIRRRLSPLKRRSSRYPTAQSDNDAAEVAMAVPDSSVKKRVRSIPYDSMPEVIDAALGTVCAPVWLGTVDEPEDDGEAEEPEAIWSVASNMSEYSDNGSPQKRGNTVSRGIISGFSLPPLFSKRPPLSPALTATSDSPHRKVEQTGFITPRVPTRHRFQQKLHSLFGENATVRTDRSARPRENCSDYVYQPADTYNDDIPSHPTTPKSSGDGNDSPIDNTPPAPAASVQASIPASPVQKHTAMVDSVSAVVSSTPKRHLKRQASQEIDADTHSSAVHRHNYGPSDTSATPVEATHQPPANKKRRVDFDEDKLQSWISNLQRLIKGKIQFTEEALKQLSDLLTQIDSVKTELDISIPIVDSLHQSIHKLAQLQDIPFGDPYKLRKKARLIATAWA
ncbi:hypothetical protein EDC04DRAFT_1477421 [Pisolithus marmoratus]|nr:hypothetical protein EDC04DRAFT_1477421 [Pisolithus marmoratus]